MKHHRFAIKVWLTTAITTVASLAVVSGASAMRNARDPFNEGYGRTEPNAVVSNSSGFNWGIVAIAAGFILAAALVAYAVSRVGRTRGSLVAAN